MEPHPVTIESALMTAGIAAVVGAVGWITAYILTGWREDRTKRLQLQLEQSATQIREFYAPLVALTQQLDSTVDVLHSVTKGKSGEEHDELVGLMYFQFFLPIHEQINEILKTKVRLLKGQ